MIRGIILTSLFGYSCMFNSLTALAKAELPANVDPGAIVRANSDYMSVGIAQQKVQKENTENIKSLEIDKTVEDNAKIEKFKLKGVIFSGNTVYKSADLQKFTKNMLEQDISLDDVRNLTDKITKLYQINGYMTSFAYIPPQTINDGNLELKIFEGKVGDITIKGNKWARTSYIKNNIFKSNAFDRNKVFNVNTLRASIHEINETDYLNGQVTIQKGVKPETTDIILDVKERIPLKLGTSWDNMGRNLVGVQRANITLADNNLTGFGDSIYSGVSLASKTFGLNTGYSVPLGPHGTKLNLGYSFSNVNIGGAYEQFNIKGRSHVFHPYISQPVYKSEDTEINSSIAFDFINSKTTLQKEVVLQNYNVRALRFGVNGVREDNNGRWIAGSEFSTGIPLFGATTAGGRGIGSSKFFRMNANLIRVQAFPYRITGIARLSGQYSPNALLSPEQMQLGGMYSVRGFTEGLLLGDIGYNASLELRRPIPYMPHFSVPYWKGKKLHVDLKDKIHVAAFYDQGFAKMIHQGVPNSYLNFLQSTGVGLRIQLSKFVSANIDMGIPLGRKRSEDQNGVKFHFGLSSDIF